MRIRRPFAVLAVTALALASTVVIAAPAYAADQVVTSEADSGAGSLREAVSLVGAGETITFAPSVNEILLESAITFPVGVTIDGPGRELLTIARGDIGAFFLFELAPTSANQDFFFEGFTLDGRVYPALSPSGANNPLVYAGDADVNDISFDDVYALQNTSVGRGGFLATFNIGGDVTIEDGQFTALHAGEGGALSLEGGTDVTIRRAFFGGDSATSGHGGAIEIQDVEDVLIEETEFVNDFTDSVANGDGGAVFVEGADSLTVDASAFTNNRAVQSGNGGAIHATAVTTSVSVTETTFVSNDVGLPLGGGGALSVQYSPAPVTVEDSRFEGSAADFGGAIVIYDVAGGLDVTRSTFLDNDATDSGGAIYVGLSSGGFDITDSSFASNTADDDGGAVFLLDDEAVTVTRTQFDTNDAGDRGGALWLGLDSASSLAIADSQFTDNTASTQATALALGSALPGTSRTVDIDRSTFALTTGASLPLVDLGDVFLGGSAEIADSTLDAGAGASGPVVRVGVVEQEFGIVHTTLSGAIGVEIEESNTGDINVSHSAFETTGTPIGFGIDPASAALRVNVAWSAFTQALDPTVADDIVGNQTAVASLGLAPLAANGGITFLGGDGLLTRLPLAGSPLINAGQTPPPGSASAFDQRGSGFPRVVSGRIDIGALEFSPTAPVTPTLPPTGGTVSWWLLAVAGVVLSLGVAAVLRVSPRRPSRRH